MRTRTRKSWREKLAQSKGLPKVVNIRPAQEKRWGKGRMVVPSPLEVDAAIREIPRGRTATMEELRRVLAARHGVETACPLATGVFAWIAAHAAMEDEAEGRGPVTPWWRVLKAGGRLNPKLPGGAEEQARRLKAEGAEAPGLKRG